MTGGRDMGGALRAVLLALALAAAATLPGCGGGSPSDIVEPQDVEVALLPLEPAGPRSVGLALESAAGGNVRVQVTATELEGATGVAFELSFDPDLLEFTGVGSGSFFGTAAVVGANVVQEDPGRLVGVAASPEQASGTNGSGTLLTLQFRLKQLRDAQSTLIFGDRQSLVYGPDGVAGQHVFTNARLVTRIRLLS